MSIDLPALRSALVQVLDLLTDFAADPLFTEKFSLVFGSEVSPKRFAALVANLPEIEVLADGVLEGALGAFSTQTGKIYLSESVVNGDGTQLRAVLLEEIGHYLDSVFNAEDATGDEGAILAALVSGESLSSQQLQALKLENDTAIVEIDGQQIQIERMATNNLYFNITINDPLDTYSTYYTAIESTIQASGAFWDNYIGGVNANLEVVVNFNNSIPRATGRSVTSSFVRNNGTYNIFEQGAAAEIRTGVDPNGTAPDIEIEFNPDYLINELWFDSDPLLRTAPVPINRTDAISVLMHELAHAFSFNGWMNNTTGTMPGNYQSPFDEKIDFINGNFFFSGSQAMEVYGSPVPIRHLRKL